MAALRSTFMALLVASATSAQDHADLVLWNGKIVTLEEAAPEVEALAMKDGRILAIGTRGEIEPYVGEATEVIDLGGPEGAVAIPGFIEGHGHFLGIGDAAMQLDLMHVSNWGEVVAMVAAAVKEAQPGELIRGRGWHQEKWDEPPPGNVEGLPVHDSLSAVSPENPVILGHASGHATFANEKAMALAGISRETPDPPGGTIVRDAKGRAIGAFRETASGLLGRVYQYATPAPARRKAEYADRECLAKGITSFQDAGSSFETVDVLVQMVDEDALGVRLWVMLREPNERLAAKLDEYRMIGYRDRLTVRGIKRAIDGALGSHGAWLLAPYADLPSSRGLNTSSIESVEATAKLAIEHGYQLCVHAIGDRGNREVLDVFQRAIESRPDGSDDDLRWRVEHAQHLHPDDIPRFAELGVVASMQGVHCTSDGPWVVARLGETRAREGAYVWRSLLDSGAVVTNGTDAPVEDVDPIASFYATVGRVTRSGDVFYGEQSMTRLEALRSYTSSCAYAAFEEDVKGTLAPGKLADVTVLSKDLLTVPLAEIPTAEVLYTVVGGKVLYRRDG